MKKQFGFTALEGLLVLVIVGIVGFAGWYVYNANNKTQDSYANADNANTSTVSAKKDPAKDWQTVTANDKSFSFKMPKEWVSLKESDY